MTLVFWGEMYAGCDKHVSAGHRERFNHLGALLDSC